MAPDILQALVTLIEMKDHSTAAHTWRVVLYTRAMGDEYGLTHDEVDRLGVAAAVHDIGKLDIPSEILQKAGKLTDAEFAVIRTHPVTGHERMLAMGEDDPLVLDLVRHHHERVDGLGYPDRLPGDAIPMSAKFFSVIDTFDALTSHRPYRHEVGDDAARRAVIELQAGIGTRYDARAVEMFAALYHDRKLDWILQHFNDGNEVPGVAELRDVRRVGKAIK
jgi:HD-GYP domain-containing protein (c-di-GMP phosphodiesterase class II)